MGWNDGDLTAAVGGEGEVEADAAVGQEVGDILTPFNNYDGVGAIEGFGEFVRHNAGVGQTIEVVVDEFAGLTVGAGEIVALGDGEARTSNRFSHAQAGGKTGGEGGFASANIAHQLKNRWQG